MDNKTNLTQIPGFGAKMSQHLMNAGYPTIESLKGQNAEEIYEKHRLIQGPGNMSCRCVLYGYRLAVAYANHDGVLPPGKQNWYDWKD